MAAKNTLRELHLTQVVPSEVALRSVNKESDKYQELVDSIRKAGVINPVSVREIKDTQTGKTVYGLIDGLHRYTGSIDAGLDTIPAHIMAADEAQVLELQIMGNLHVIQTRPADYSKQLLKLIALDPTTTVLERAQSLGKSITWLNDRLNLVKLTEEIQELVNDGTINVTNAIHLAKLPPDEQKNFADRAITMTPSEFVPTVSARTKEIKDAKRQGKSAEGAKPFEAPAFLQNTSEIKKELKELNVGKGLINQFGLTTPIDAWQMAISWVLHLDPLSMEVSRNKEEDRKRVNEEAKAKRKEERDQKKAKEAATAVAGLSDEDDEDEDEDE